MIDVVQKTEVLEPTIVNGSNFVANPIKGYGPLDATSWKVSPEDQQMNVIQKVEENEDRTIIKKETA